MQVVNLKKQIRCYHCGEVCVNTDIISSDKYFCCAGCKAVYEILNANNLCKYYAFDENPGITQQKFDSVPKSRFSYLNDQVIINQLINFSENGTTTVNFSIPQIHCSSCIWLLENLHKLNPGIILSEVNFMQKNVFIKFRDSEISLRSLVELLVSIGYEPQINLGDLETKIKYRSNRSLYLKIGLAGFCFGNIMLFSFPEYLSLEGLEQHFRQFFGIWNILLGIPVFFYSASDYFKSAWNGIKQKTINIDFPICLGLSVLFFRSVYEISSGSGPGFIDSMTGLIFFLLIGKVFQSKTYDALNFERNYKSYFPISVTVKKDGKETNMPVSSLTAGDRIILRHNELIPADGILFLGSANIDYSFVTGESAPVEKVIGEIVYAGGRQTGGAIELEVIRTVSQSYMTQLWNKDTFVKKDENRFNTMVNIVGKYFTFVILSAAALAFIYWLPVSIHTAINAFTAVLIIACPCGIALTSPFALGNAIRILGKNKFYVKNANVIERISKIDTIVFDKTGTITKTGDTKITFNGAVLTSYEQRLVKSLVRNSTHPLSAKIDDAIDEAELFETKYYKESTGEGIEAIVDHHLVRIGAALFVADRNHILNYPEKISDKSDTRVFIAIDNHIKGYFTFNNIYRKGLDEIAAALQNDFDMYVVSGDNEGEKEALLGYFNDEDKLKFNQSPQQKLSFIERLQRRDKKVLMIGDGLNDAGALKQSDVGIALSEDITNFSPACDAILDASVFSKLNKMIRFSRNTKAIIIISFIISIIYNIIGVTIAFQSVVSPMIAAILMPLSSISVVIFTVTSTNLMAKRKGL
jgi:P-type Cu+ transporter